MTADRVSRNCLLGDPEPGGCLRCKNGIVNPLDQRVTELMKLRTIRKIVQRAFWSKDRP